ncbi:hypothetical protein IMM1_24410 [Pseudocoprococcus immobilis]
MPYEKIGKNEPVCIADEVPFEIPESWEWVRLGTICTKLVDGDHNPPKGCISKTEYIMASSTNINNDSIVELEKVRYLTPEIFQKENERTKVEIGDIFFTSVGSLGRSCVYTGGLNICFQRSVSVITTLILNYYLKYCLDSGYIQQKIIREATGTAQKGFYLNQLSTVLIPVPPKREQYKIVEQYEKVVSFLASYSKAEQKIKILNSEFPELLKKSILQEAIQGKLVPQVLTDEPASALLERIRIEKEQLIQEGKIKRDKHESIIFRRDNSHYEKCGSKEICIDDEIPFEIPETWEWERWGNISQSIQYGYNAPAKSNGRIKMVRISDIQDNNVLWQNVPFCEIKEKDVATYLLKPNDILFARTGGTVGKSYLVQDISEEAVYAGYLIRTRYSQLLCPQYLKCFMESELYWSQLRNGTIATAQPNCNGKTLGKMLLPIPPLAEQKRIVEKQKELFDKISFI